MVCRGGGTSKLRRLSLYVPGSYPHMEGFYHQHGDPSFLIDIHMYIYIYIVNIIYLKDT